MRVTLNLTHRCNLACKYCYAGEGKSNDMDFDTAKKIINFSIAKASPDQKLSFGLFGGEPFLCFEMMREITNYLKKSVNKAGLPYQINITTNGTILTDEILKYLIDEKVNLCVSIDGPEIIHNKNRIYSNGNGSHAKVSRNLKTFAEHLGSLQVNTVYGPETLTFLPDLLPYFVEEGIRIIHLNPNITSDWPDESITKIPETYMQLANNYVQYYQKGHPISVNLIDSKVVLFLKGGYSAKDRCGMGETEWGFAPSGNIYPCERFIGDDQASPYCIGNIHEGLYPERHCAILERRGNINEKCQTCSLSKFCMNWCGCTNFHLTGHTDLASHMLCISERATIMAAKHAFLSLKDNNSFIDHLMAYVYEGRHYKEEGVK